MQDTQNTKLSQLHWFTFSHKYMNKLKLTATLAVFSCVVHCKVIYSFRVVCYKVKLQQSTSTNSFADLNLECLAMNLADKQDASPWCLEHFLSVTPVSGPRPRITARPSSRGIRVPEAPTSVQDIRTSGHREAVFRLICCVWESFFKSSQSTGH